MTLENMITQNDNSHVLIAPIGLGKTSFIFHLIKKENKIIFVAPLRSIVEEILKREETFSIREFDVFNSVKRGVLVVTPESLLPFDLEYFSTRNTLFVLDEFHLYYEWADTFREKMRDFLENLYALEVRILGLTATMGQNHYKKLRIDSAFFNREMRIIDLGNMNFHYPPSSSTGLTYGQIDFEILRLGLFSKKKVLIFVKTRKQVSHYVNKLKKYGVDVIGCVGGESSYFIEAYDRRFYQVIVSTKVLSHGVNLGRIDRVFILDNVPEFERVQMCGRGGRDGNSYTISYLIHSKPSKIKDRFKELFSIFALKVLKFFYE